MRREFLGASLVILAIIGTATWINERAAWMLVPVVPVIGLGIVDMIQSRHSIRRNFPVIGHFRYLLEAIRPEINQYFVESNSDGVPFSREQRSIVYQRAKGELDTLPFGTQMKVDEIGYEWVTHSLAPVTVSPAGLRVQIGGPDCQKPYSASILNVSAMSYGSLSKNAVLALNGGARTGGFAHNTGEGGLTQYHLAPGGDIVWQIGTAYFGCRTPKGHFCEDRFREKANLGNVKMIELKLSQGAKPSHGGILPAVKLTPEIAEIRGVSLGEDVISPPAHETFKTPIGLLEFIARLRVLSGGKPVGFKLCVGKKREFVAICKAMRETGITPDFITVDGGEGGTGAAPLEFSNHLGSPLRDGLLFVHNCLVGFDLRKKIRLICSGRTVTGFDLIVRFALGADACNSARAMMMALGCIQALRCNSNKCPTGVATQNPHLVSGLDVSDKAKRVANFHAETIKSTAEILGAMGVSGSHGVRPWHVRRRTGLAETRHFGELYNFLAEGELLKSPLPSGFQRAVDAAVASSFHHAEFNPKPA